MPGCCAVDGCTNWDRVKDTLFHRFPKKEEVRKAWIDSCGKKKVNADHARICSNHFTKTDYERNLKYEMLGIPVPRSRRTLRKDAVPSKHIPKVKGKCNDTRGVSWGPVKVVALLKVWFASPKGQI
ncbi:THAP domain-containing protein 2-like [Penaeus vannamei]|uniref:THAP domain-containing protein 2-like n=1 Tax=Penaeus vannamei TaxID=6689 RepID=UPI00387FACF1